MPFKLSAAFMSFMSFLSCALLPTTALAGGTIAVFGDDSYLQITNAPTSRDDITQVAAGRRTGYAL